MSDADREEMDPAMEARRTLEPHQLVCGNCIFWRATQRDERERWIGPCRVMPDRGEIPSTSASCDRFTKRGAPIPQAPPPERRRRSRTVRRVEPLLRRAGEKAPSPRSIAGSQGEAARRGPSPLDPKREVLDMTQEELLDVLQDFFGAGPIPSLAKRWEGGLLLLKPADESLQAKEVPVDVFFKKLVRVRDQIRLLEQKINGHEKLSGTEKVELQAYLTRCYGALTTFNVLFAEAEDRFTGEKGG